MSASLWRFPRVTPEVDDTLRRSGLADQVDAFCLEVDLAVNAFLEGKAESNEGAPSD